MAFFVIAIFQPAFGKEKKSSSIYDRQLISAQKLLSKTNSRKEGIKQLETIARYAKSKKHDDRFNAGCEALAILARIKRKACGYEFAPPKKSFKGIGEASEKDTKKKAIENFEKKLAPFDEYSIINDWQYDKKYKYSNPQILPFIESAYYKALNKENIDNTKQALKMLTYAESRTEGIDKAEVLCQWGELLRELKEYRRAQTYLKNALDYGNDWFKVTKSYDEEKKKIIPGSRKWQNLKTRINNLLSVLEFDMLAVDYSEAYADYVKMRNYYEKQDWYHAYPLTVKLKTEYPETVYGDVGRLYWCRILLKNEIAGENKDKTLPSGVKEMEKFVEDNPYGLYRGEALMDLGKHFLENKWDADKSSVYYKKALDWFRKVKKQKDAIDLYAMPEKVKVVAAPRGQISTLNKWRQTEYREPDIKEIINRKTAPNWYISENEKNCLFMVGFFLFIEGKYDKAKEYFEQVKDVDSNVSKLVGLRWPNVYWRLISSCNVNRMLFSAENKKYLKGKNKLRCALAELNYLCEKFDKSKSLFQSIINDPTSKPQELALGKIGIANCIDKKRTPDTANQIKKQELECYKTAIKLAKNTSIEGTAIFYSGLLYLSTAWDGRHEKALKCFQEYINRFPSGAHIKNAKFRYINSLISIGKIKEAEKLFKKFKFEEKYQESGYTKALLRQFSNYKKGESL